MRFRRGDNMLLFDSGKMRVKTELMLAGTSGRTLPAEEAFAAFFTAHYDEIAEKYPVYRELFEYAKLVALAKYLKESGVPLHWFLMANKDLVLTEDSPGTVEALAKGSDYWRGLRIEGGVELVSQGAYIYDEAAVRAIGDAMAASSARDGGGRSPVATARQPASPSIPSLFQSGNETFTVVPQHSLTSGRGSNGMRYQTDVALRTGGIEPGLEFVRCFDPGSPQAGEFGSGWRLMIPYRVRPADDTRREFLNGTLPERMTVMNLLTGAQEVLTFSTERYSIAGYVPDSIGSSRIVGLFILSDGSFRMADKIGNEFAFSPSGYLTAMVFSESHHMEIEYAETVDDICNTSSCTIAAEGPETDARLGMSVPLRLRVSLPDGASEILELRKGQGQAEYAPVDRVHARTEVLAVRADGTMRLVSTAGGELVFDSSGAFVGLAEGLEEPLVASISSGSRKVTFAYCIAPSGRLRVERATVEDTTGSGRTLCAVDYQYDDEGRLMKVARTADAGADLALAQNGGLRTAAAMP
jgi:hypothetical protein